MAGARFLAQVQPRFLSLELFGQITLQTCTLKKSIALVREEKKEETCSSWCFGGMMS